MAFNEKLEAVVKQRGKSAGRVLLVLRGRGTVDEVLSHRVEDHGGMREIAICCKHYCHRRPEGLLEQ